VAFLRIAAAALPQPAESYARYPSKLLRIAEALDRRNDA